MLRSDPYKLIDYNGTGRWSRNAILTRYDAYAQELSLEPRDLSPHEHFDPVVNTRWVDPVMGGVLNAIIAGDLACIRIGAEFIEEDERFAFGRILKSATARRLRQRAELLTRQQKVRIQHRVFSMLRSGRVPNEFREYAKLVRRIGFNAGHIGKVTSEDPYVRRFYTYFQRVLSGAN